MTSIFAALLIVFISHWTADFVFQTDKMAKGKSKDVSILLSHVLTYTFVTFLIITPCFSFLFGFSVKTGLLTTCFVLINGGMHFYVDYFTSRLSSKLWAEGRVHDFFVIIGLDQLIHVLLYLFTFWFIFTTVVA